MTMNFCKFLFILRQLYTDTLFNAVHEKLQNNEFKSMYLFKKKSYLWRDN